MKPPERDGEMSDVDLDRSVERFRADIDRFLAVIESSEGLDLARIKVTSPFLSVLRLPLGAMLEALGVHCVRHIQQAENAVSLAHARG